jgi:hypothetical protein
MNDLEFEKNRQEILKNAKINNKNSLNNNKEHLWKYEIEKYRKQKKKELFFSIGSIAGIISLILTVALHYYEIMAFIKTFF